MRLARSTRGPCAAGLVGLAVLLPGTPAAAGPATDRLRDFFGTVNTVLADPAMQSQPLDKVARVKTLVSDIADVRGAAAAALEHEWDARTPAERDEFTWLFAELLERGLVARLAGTVSPVNGMVLTWRGESLVGDETRVTTVVEARDGRKISVEYRMIQQRGRWLVRDVVVDGVSTIDNYRAQFKRVLRHSSYAGLVAQLRAKLGEDTLMFAHSAPAAPPTAASTMTASAPGSSHPAAPRLAARVAPPSPAKTGPRTVAVTATPPVIAKSHHPSTAQRTPPSVVQVATPPTKSVAVARPARVAPSARVTSVPATQSASAPTPSVTRPSPGSVLESRAVGKSVPARTVPDAAPRREDASIESSPITAADVFSPIGAIELTERLLPSIVMLMLGFAGVTGVVFLRRRASSALVLQRLGNGDKRLVLVHPVPRVAKVGERGRKGRVVPPPRHPTRHVHDAHGA